MMNHGIVDHSVRQLKQAERWCTIDLDLNWNSSNIISADRPDGEGQGCGGKRSVIFMFILGSVLRSPLVMGCESSDST